MTVLFLSLYCFARLCFTRQKPEISSLLLISLLVSLFSLHSSEGSENFSFVDFVTPFVVTVLFSCQATTPQWAHSGQWRWPQVRVSLICFVYICVEEIISALDWEF